MRILPRIQIKNLQSSVNQIEFKTLAAIFGLFASAALYGADAPGIFDDQIVFGQSACLSGPNSLLGETYRIGIVAAFEELNDNGGIDGRKIELITLDDAYEPELAAANASHFVEKANVFAVVGGVGTPTTARIAPVLKSAGIPFVGHVTGANFLHDKKRFPNVVNLRASYLDEVRVLTDYMINERGLKRLGIIYQDDAFGRSVLKDYLTAIEEQDGKLLAKTRYTRNTHAVHASLFALARADLDAILLVGTYAANAEIINLANSLGHDYTLANLSFSLSQEIRQRVEELSDRILLTEVMPDPNDPTSMFAARFRNAMLFAGDSASTLLNEVSFEGYLLGRYIISTLNRMDGQYTRESFLEHLMPTQPVSLDDWSIGFQADSNTGSHYVRLTVLDEKEKQPEHATAEGG